MKRTSWIVLVAAVVLFVWGMADFYHFVVTGKAVLQYYGETELMSRLVNYSFLQGAIKAILGLLLLVMFCYGRRKKK